MAYELTEQKKVGLGLIGFGFFFSFLGVMLFFDRGLLALANIFCLVGVVLLVGWHSTLNIFISRANYKGSASFLLGLLLLFLRWPILGILLEICGCVALFGGFWSSIKVFLYQIPVVGWILRYPVWVIPFMSLFATDSCYTRSYTIFLGIELLVMWLGRTNVWVRINLDIDGI